MGISLGDIIGSIVGIEWEYWDVLYHGNSGHAVTP